MKSTLTQCKQKLYRPLVSAKTNGIETPLHPYWPCRATDDNQLEISPRPSSSYVKNNILSFPFTFGMYEERIKCEMK